MSDDSFVEQPNPKWNIFQKTARDTSTVDRQFVEYYDKSPDPGSNTSWRIQVRDVDQYVDMSDAYIQLQFKITSAAGAELNASENVAPCNSGYSFFSQYFLRANGQVIEQITQGTIPYAQIVGYLQNSKDFSQTSAELEFWYPDEIPDIPGCIPGASCEKPASLANTVLPTGVARIAIANAADNAVVGSIDMTAASAAAADHTEFVKKSDIIIGRNPLFNPGHHKRWLATRNSRVVTLMLPLRKVFGYLDDVQSVTRGIQWELELHKNADNNVLFSTYTGGANYKLEFTRLSLWVPNLKPSFEMSTRLEGMLTSGEQITQHWFTREVYQSEPYAQAQTRVNWLIKTAASFPEMVIICAQDQNRTGSQFSNTSHMQNTLRNHSNFDNMGITHAQLRVGGQALYPREAFEIPAEGDVSGWAHGKYARLYQQYLECANKLIGSEIGSAIGYRDFGELHPMFFFNLRDHPEGVFDKARTTDIRFEATVNAPAADYPAAGALPLLNRNTGGAPKSVYPVAKCDHYVLYAVVISPRELLLSASGGRIEMKL